MVVVQFCMIDLHTHSTHSDGRQTVAQLLKRAEERGLVTLSITDHNSVGAYLSDLRDPKVRNIFTGKIITGIEIAFEHDGVSNELLGYGFVPDKMALSPLLDKDRTYKMQMMFLEGVHARLTKLGFVVRDLETVKAGMANCWSVRSQFKPDFQNEANADVIRKLCKKYGYTDFRTLFINEFVQPTGKYYVPRGKDTMAVAAGAIKDAGGLVFMAHPSRVNSGKIIPLLDYARKHNLIDGVEVYYSEHSDEHIRAMEKYCKKYNLLMSGGSDSHDETVRLARKKGEDTGKDLVPQAAVSVWADKLNHF